MKTKICSKCKKEKSLDEFENQRNLRGVLTKISICRLCRKRPASYIKEYYAKNKERLDAYHKEYRDRNKETAAAYYKIWYDKNKERWKKHTKEYYRSHKKEQLAVTKKWHLEHKEETKLKKDPTNKKHFEKIEKQGVEERKNKLKQEAIDRKVLQEKLTKERLAKRRAYGYQWKKDYLKDHREEVNAKHLQSYYRRMKKIYGIDWEVTRHKGEELVYRVLQAMFPGVKILRGFQGSIATNGTCDVRKHVWPDFTFSLLDKKVIIEHNGNQHYKPFKQWPRKSFISLQKRDRWLRRYCKKNGIILIEIRQKKVGYNKDKIASAIKEELHNHGIYEPMDLNGICGPIQSKAS